MKMFRLADDLLKMLPVNLKGDPRHFTCHSWLPEERLVVGTHLGELMIFEGTEFKKTLDTSPMKGMTIGAVAAFTKGFVAGCDGGRVRIYEKSDDARLFYKLTAEFAVSGDSSRVIHLAVAANDDNLVVVLASGQVYEFKLSSYELYKADDIVFRPLVTSFHSAGPTGDTGVLSLDACVRKPLFVTAGADHTVRIWNYSMHWGASAPVPQETVPTLELVKRFKEVPSAVAFHPSGLHILVAFDSTLQLMNVLMDDIKAIKDFPMRRANAVAFSHGGQCFAANANNGVSIIDTYTGTVLRSLRAHSDRVDTIAWSADDQYLLTSGKDGMVYRWDVQTGRQRSFYDTEGFHMSVMEGNLEHGDASHALMVGRHGRRKDKRTFRHVDLTAPRGQQLLCEIEAKGDPVGHVCSIPNMNVVVAATAAPGRPGQLRVYQLPFVDPAATEGTAEDSGARGAASGAGGAAPLMQRSTHGTVTPPFRTFLCHGAPVTAMKLVWDQGLLITAAQDGTISLMFTTEGARSRRGSMAEAVIANVTDGGVASSGPHSRALPAGAGMPFAEEILVTTAALQGSRIRKRKLESKVQELKLENERALQFKKMAQEESMREVREKFEAELGTERRRLEELRSDKSAMEHKFDSQVGAMEEQHAREFADIDESYKEKIATEVERFEELVKERDTQVATWTVELDTLTAQHAEELEHTEADYRERIAEEKQWAKALQVEDRTLNQHVSHKMDDLENAADTYMDRLRTKYEARLATEKAVALKLSGDNALQKRNYKELERSKDQLKAEIQGMLDREKQLYDHIASLEKDRKAHKKEILEREETLADKDSRIFDLRKKNQELEKFKFVLNYKIQELKRQIMPRKREIKDMRDQMKEMELELLQYHKANAALLLTISELKLKRNGVQGDATALTESLQAKQGNLAQVRRDLHLVAQHVADVKALKDRVTQLYHRYVHGDATSFQEGQKAGGDSAELQKEIGRHRVYLEKSVDGLKRKLAKDTALHRKERQRLMRENTVLTKEINDLRRELQFMRMDMSGVRAGVEVDFGAARTGVQALGLGRTAARYGVFGEGLVTAEHKAKGPAKSKIVEQEASKAKAAALSAAAQGATGGLGPRPPGSRASTRGGSRGGKRAAVATLTAAVAPTDELPGDAPVLREMDIQQAQLLALGQQVRKLRAAVAADTRLEADAAMPQDDMARDALSRVLDGGGGPRPGTRERLPPLVAAPSAAGSPGGNIWDEGSTEEAKASVY